MVVYFKTLVRENWSCKVITDVNKWKFLDCLWLLQLLNLQILLSQGQSESKKSAKKGSGPQTKGTAMSFGFKKKSGNSSKKQSNNINNSLEKEKEMYDQQTATIITNHNVIKDEQYNNLITASDDDNGNTGEISFLLQFV